MSTRILIADDHGVMRAGLRAILEDEPEILVVGEAANGEEALRLVGQYHPDILLLDIGMPGLDGIAVTRRLANYSPRPKVIILSVYEDDSILREAIRAGASGYMIKRAAEEELITAIRVVSRGDMYVHPAIMHLLLKDLTTNTGPKQAAIDAVTPREREVMAYIIRGYTNRQVAEELSISVRTVEGHRATLFDKLGLKNRVELIEFAEKHGLVS